MMKKFLNEWYNNILKIENELNAAETSLTQIKPGPGKWAPNEILGHLIDSAINNHRRFILMQIQGNLVFEGYEHTKWVALHNYINRDWSDILDTWLALNLNIIECLEEISAQSWAKEFTDHNLDKIAWQSLTHSKSATMEYLVKDYFGHLGHHLKQICSLLNIDNPLLVSENAGPLNN